MTENQNGLSPALFNRIDNSPDTEFYRQPRFVAHIDDTTIAALTLYYSEILFDGADVLDLMSSWISHLPDEPHLGNVSGLGMNEAELAANPRLTNYQIADLNANPRLPYPTASFDFVFIAVSIQYLIQPVEVFRDLGRVLRSGARAVVATSHRCFPTKAIRAFHEMPPADRLQLIAQYFRLTNEFDDVEILDRSPASGDPLWLVTARRK